MKLALAALAALLLTGCASIARIGPAAVVVRPGPSDDAPPLVPAVRRPNLAGGVFNPDAGLSLTSDSRAFRVGDVVTVTLQEVTQASKKAGSSFSKGSSAKVTPLTLAGKSIKTDLGISANRDFAGDSSSTQQNALQGAITVMVQEVLPNGLLRVAGEKSLTLNQGEEFVRLRGYLRAADIDADNQVSSLRIANARIAYAAQGTLADATAPGWLTRFFVGPWMPF